MFASEGRVAGSERRTGLEERGKLLRPVRSYDDNEPI